MRFQSRPSRRKLRGRQPHHRIPRVRPPELAILQPLGEQAYAGAIPIDQLHSIGSFRPEHIHDGVKERIEPMVATSYSLAIV